MLLAVDVQLGLSGPKARRRDVKSIHHILERRRKEGVGLDAGPAKTREIAVGLFALIHPHYHLGKPGRIFRPIGRMKNENRNLLLPRTMAQRTMGT